MPVTYSIDQAIRIIHTQCIGDVHLNEVLEHFDILPNDPRCPEELDVILDLREMTRVPESFQLRRVSAKIEGVRNRVRFNFCAVVVQSMVIYGMMRVFSAFSTRGFQELEVFNSLEKAQEWLAEKRRDQKM